MSTVVDFTKVFRYAVQGVVETAKFMDAHIDPCCDAILQLIDNTLENHKAKPITDEDKRAELKSNIKERLGILYQDLNMKITCPKEKDGSKKANAYTLFVQTVRPKYAKPGMSFAEIGQAIGDAWNNLSVDDKSKY